MKKHQRAKEKGPSHSEHDQEKQLEQQDQDMEGWVKPGKAERILKYREDDADSSKDIYEAQGIDVSKLHGSAWDREEQAIEMWAASVPGGPQAVVDRLRRELGVPAKVELAEPDSAGEEINVIEEDGNLNNTELEDETAKLTGIVDESRELGLLLRKTITPDEKYRLDENDVLHATPFGSSKITSKGDVVGGYTDVKGFLKGADLTGQREKTEDNTITPTAEAHHLIPQNVLEMMNMPTDTAPSVGLWAHEHMSGIHAFIGTLPEAKSAASIKEYYADAYGSLGVPEWGELVANYIEQNKKTIDENLAQTDTDDKVETLDDDDT